MFTEHFKFCLDQLRRFDNDRYLAILLTPEKHRAGLCALYAFNVEMARIPYAVSEPMLGEIRFQWWRDTLEALTPLGSPGHEIAEALRETLFDSPLAPLDLIPLIDGYARMLREEPFQTLSDLVEDVQSIDVQCLQLALRFTGEYEKSPSSANLEKLVLGYGLTARLRQLPHAASHQRLTVPMDLMSKYEIDPHDIFSGIRRPEISDAIADIVGLATDYFETGRGRDFRNSRDQLAILLPTALTPLYLSKLRRADFDIFRQSSDIPAFRRQLRYLWTKWRMRI